MLKLKPRTSEDWLKSDEFTDFLEKVGGALGRGSLKL
jgi:hypothetical protein